MNSIRLCVCITFHYAPQRLPYLQKTIHTLQALPFDVDITVITNALNEDSQQDILSCSQRPDNKLTIDTPRGLGHPYLLTWSHFPVMRERINDPSFSHFMYLEDDLIVSADNINYFLEAREKLRKHGLIPSMFRYEINPLDGLSYSTDQKKPVDLKRQPLLKIDHEHGFVNMPNPYQGMYLLDRELMLEHINGPTSSPDFGPWNIREKAAQGLTFGNIPPGFGSRNVVPVLFTTTGGKRCKRARAVVDPVCLIHHCPNNYTVKPDTSLGKTPLDQVFRNPTIMTWPGR